MIHSWQAVVQWFRSYMETTVWRWPLLKGCNLLGVHVVCFQAFPVYSIFCVCYMLSASTCYLPFCYITLSNSSFNCVNSSNLPFLVCCCIDKVFLLFHLCTYFKFQRYISIFLLFVFFIYLSPYILSQYFLWYQHLIYLHVFQSDSLVPKFPLSSILSIFNINFEKCGFQTKTLCLLCLMQNPYFILYCRISVQT